MAPATHPHPVASFPSAPPSILPIHDKEKHLSPWWLLQQQLELTGAPLGPPPRARDFQVPPQCARTWCRPRICAAVPHVRRLHHATVKEFFRCRYMASWTRERKTVTNWRFLLFDSLQGKPHEAKKRTVNIQVRYDD